VHLGKPTHPGCGSLRYGSATPTSYAMHSSGEELTFLRCAPMREWLATLERGLAREDCSVVLSVLRKSGPLGYSARKLTCV
jgi:hypothetical protein